MRRRGQAGAAGSLLALIAVFVLLYILLIPPEDRDSLLNDGQYTTNPNNPYKEYPTNGFNYNETVLSVTPGRIDYLKFKEYDHPLPAVNLYTTTNSKEEKIGDSVYVKNGIFDKKSSNITFSIEDSINSVYLSYRLNPNRNNKGDVLITLNGKNIARIDEGEVNNPEPILLSNLNSQNVLSFEVTGVGYKFWTTNEYEFQDITLFYDEVDSSTQSSQNTFTITDTEKFNLESASLKFFPDFNRIAGKLNVYINRNNVYSAVPDCGQLNKIDLSTSVLEAGQNKVVFESERGNYLVDQVLINTKLRKMTYPVYYFDLDDRFFSQSINEKDEDGNCGDIDGICPKDCDADLDKDCCLQQTSSYWCDQQPNNPDDRCRAVTSENICQLCPAGYEDSHNRPPEYCEDLCGDDTDNECLPGCSKFYDEDCCFDESPDNFWCDDVPKYGLTKCKDFITKDECDACPDGWRSDENQFKCEDFTNDDTIAILKGNYDIKLTLKFVDDNDKKAGKVFINGYQFYFQTYSDEYTKTIDNYVEDGPNSVKIEPDQTTLDIRELLIEVD